MQAILRRGALCALVALLCAFYSFTSFAGERLSRQTADRLRSATVMVYIEYAAPYENHLAWGTGFVIGNGLVMTNAHVIREQTPTRVWVVNEFLPPTEARVLAARYDTNGVINANGMINTSASGNVSAANAYSNYDVAVLSFTPPPNVQLPSLAFAATTRRNEDVFAVGYPFSRIQQRDGPYQTGPDSAKSRPPIFSGGIVNQVINGDPALVMHDAHCETGSSGGPIVNARGEVVGMQTWSTVPDGLPMNSFAIGGRDLVNFLVRYGYRPLVARQ